MHNAYRGSYDASKSVQREGGWTCESTLCFFCLSIYLHACESLWVDIYLNLLMWLGAYLCLCVCAHTLLLCVCLLLLLCLWACGRAGMEHRHFATELNSQKRAWSWPAEQYLDSVFMRRTTTAISITALWFMFVCFAQRSFDSIKKLLFLSCSPKTQMFTPFPVRVSSAAPHCSWPSMQWFP